MAIDARPVLWCFVARQLTEHTWTGLKLVTLETAAELNAIGWIVIGPDPHNEISLAEWERDHRPPNNDAEDDAA